MRRVGANWALASIDGCIPDPPIGAGYLGWKTDVVIGVDKVGRADARPEGFVPDSAIAAGVHNAVVAVPDSGVGADARQKILDPYFSSCALLLDVAGS